MLQEFNANFSNFLLSLSDAIDIANPQIASHQMRTSFLAWKIALAAKVPEDKIEKIYLAALLHDIGALSLEEKFKFISGSRKLILIHIAFSGKHCLTYHLC
jgi:HD-GYP domain-containing protein (c-di-GMP phosphodiesterase class II)